MASEKQRSHGFLSKSQLMSANARTGKKNLSDLGREAHQPPPYRAKPCRCNWPLTLIGFARATLLRPYRVNVGHVLHSFVLFLHRRNRDRHTRAAFAIFSAVIGGGFRRRSVTLSCEWYRWQPEITTCHNLQAFTQTFSSETLPLAATKSCADGTLCDYNDRKCMRMQI